MLSIISSSTSGIKTIKQLQQRRRPIYQSLTDVEINSMTIKQVFIRFNRQRTRYDIEKFEHKYLCAIPFSRKWEFFLGRLIYLIVVFIDWKLFVRDCMIKFIRSMNIF